MAAVQQQQRAIVNFGLYLKTDLRLVVQFLVVLVYLGPLEPVCLHALHQAVHLGQREALLGAHPDGEGRSSV